VDSSLPAPKLPSEWEGTTMILPGRHYSSYIGTEKA